eukprot:c5566_g1_i1.p1 GENE.c5566_g1_i1~~c5566_g1_i1.p1  ORF type:complete len:385 (-),score=109.44 c5566_g1_i1:51-1205(-)
MKIKKSSQNKTTEVTNDTTKPRRKKAWELEPHETPTLEDILTLQLKRTDLEKWVNEAFFETVKGLFVRLSLGPDKAGNIIYRIVEIADIKPGQVYEFGTATTNKYLEIQFADDKKLCEMKFISNKQFSQEEFNHWMTQLAAKHIPPPSKSYITSRKNFRNEIANFVYDEEAVNKMLKEKIALQTHSRSLLDRRLDVFGRFEEARDKGNEDEFIRLRDELKMIDEDLAQQARRENIDDVIVSRPTSTPSRHRSSMGNPSSSSNTVKKEIDFDPFARRPTRPKLVIPTKGGAKVESAATTTTTSQAKQEALNVTELNQKRAKTIEDARGIKEAFGTIDLELDQDSSETITPTTPRPMKPTIAAVAVSESTKRLSLSDYLKRQSTAN